MSNRPCRCYRQDGTFTEGELLQLDQDRRALSIQPTTGTPVELPFSTISHLYHATPHHGDTPGQFTLYFIDQRQLQGQYRSYRQDSRGTHLYHIGTDEQPIHLFIPAESPHQVTIEEHASEDTNHHTIRQVDQLIDGAIAAHASDIHLRPFQDRVEVKYRIDGALTLMDHLSIDHYPALVSRIKILGKMDIAEHHRPQDGSHQRLIDGREVDLRISTIIVVEGESVAIRILDPKRGLRTLAEIGYRTEDEQQLQEVLQEKSGLILVTGPTGSGKSTTLYACMRALRERQLNIISLEDPVEYRIDQVRQIEINDAVGSTFPKNLRHILRHDPDVILVGEIRDEETAKIALQAAYTGHLVLTTLHTGDAPSAILRLLEMGVEPYLLKDRLLGILSQRLQRTPCPDCDSETQPSCTACSGRGYIGRSPDYEWMRISEKLRALIRPNITAEEIRQQAIADGMVPMGHPREHTDETP